MDPHQIFLQKKFKQVAKLISIPQAKILDIGCNDGTIKNFLHSDTEYFGIDINETQIQQLQQKGIKAKKSDLNKDIFPFQFERFDYILMLDIIEHVIDPRLLLQQAKQRLKSNGKIIITLPNDYHILNKLRFILNQDITEDSFAPYGHLHIFPIKSGENFLKQNNLKIIKKIPIPTTKPNFLSENFKNYLGNKFPQSFARDILYLLEPI